MLGPRSVRECERGVNEGVGCADLYEKRFLCGVEGVRLKLAGGVKDLSCCGMDWGISSLNISERRMDEYVRLASSVFWPWSSFAGGFLIARCGVAGDAWSCSRL